MSNQKLKLKKIGIGEILSRAEMSDVFLGSGSGSKGSGSRGSGSVQPPLSLCTAKCTCPNVSLEFSVAVSCEDDCEAIDQQGVRCIKNGIPGDTVNCRSLHPVYCVGSIT